jgi:hypothetical protein
MATSGSQWFHLAPDSCRGSAYCTEDNTPHCSAPRNWGANVTLLASMTLSGMEPTSAVEVSTTRADFEAYLERALAPSLPGAQAEVLDNLSSAHKEGRGS